MADLTFRVVEGQFRSPNIDNRDLKTANVDVNASSSNLLNAALLTGVVQLGKQSAIQLAGRAASRSGNRSSQRAIENTISIVADIGTVGTAFLAGGPLGAGLAGIVIGVQKGFRALDIAIDRERQDVEARELRRRAGINLTYRGGEYV